MSRKGPRSATTRGVDLSPESPAIPPIPLESPDDVLRSICRRVHTVPSRIVRPPTRTGPSITARDIEIVSWIALHGLVTPEQVARHFFTRPSGEVGQWAAYRRLRKLAQLELIRRDHTFWKQPQVLRVTPIGAKLVNVGVGPAKIVLAEIPHALAVVDLLRNSAPSHLQARR